MNTSRETHYVEVERRGCCEGYALTPARTCAPICLKACQFGKCVAPNRCECSPEPTANQPGYAGPLCNRFVCSAPERWGPNCDKECQCSETAFCDARSGNCLCRPGWRGANCTEECNSQSGCDDLPYLPPLFEPEVNIIKTDDNVAGRMSSALTLESSIDHETNDEDKRVFQRMLTTHLQINLFMVLIVSGLIFAVFLYKKKLSQIKNELYYAAYPGSNPRGSSDSSSGYSSVYNANGTITNRPRMPLPSERNNLGKNLSFDAATRNALSEKGIIPSDKQFFPTINSKIEKHLFESKESAQHNIYSDIESNHESSCVGVPAAAENQLSIQVENEYQVPKSPVRPLSETTPDTNLYEELMPDSPANVGGNQK